MLDTRVVCWSIGQQGPQPKKLLLDGKDNYGNSRQPFADMLAETSDNGFVTVAKERIWLSAYAFNNPHTDYHWQADACYDEAQRRGKPELYSRAWNKAAGKE